ncbi:hypothetical protein HanRHA438_Chr14g0667571 [Helianthus annuus]|nr:hypothetical protein HanRHA438_Chr14g0667571 [Helianthus annuus]
MVISAFCLCLEVLRKGTATMDWQLVSHVCFEFLREPGLQFRMRRRLYCLSWRSGFQGPSLDLVPRRMLVKGKAFFLQQKLSVVVAEKS